MPQDQDDIKGADAMKQASTPGPLDIESVKLLVKGDLCLTPDGAKVFGHSTHWDHVFVLWFADHEPFELDACAFIGRPDADGWMPWSGGKNPVPGREVDVLLRDGELGEVDSANAPSDALQWSHDCDTPIVGFRLAPTAPVEASGSEREHGPKCWGKTSLSDEMAHCYCGSTALSPQPSGETREGEIRAALQSLLHYCKHGAGNTRLLKKAMDRAILALIRPAPVASGGQHSSGEIKAAYKRGWNDRESDIIERAERIAPMTTPARAEALDEGAAGERYDTVLEALVEAMPKEHDVTGPQFERVAKAITKALPAHPSPTLAADADRVRRLENSLENMSGNWADATVRADRAEALCEEYRAMLLQSGPGGL